MIATLIRAIRKDRILRLYVAIVLIAAAAFSSLPFSFLPILLLLGYIFVWLWPFSEFLKLFMDYFILYALSALFNPVIGPFFSLLPSLPVLLLINQDLQRAARAQFYQEVKYPIFPTRVGTALAVIAILVLILSLLLGSWSLVLASAVALLYLGLLGMIVIRGMSAKPVEEKQVSCRLVAGSEEEIPINISGKTKVGGLLFLTSPYKWLRVNPGIMFLTPDKLDIKVQFSPPLSGPAAIKIDGYAIDRWGLVQVHFSLEPVLLYVIPRARYAEWLAEKYLEKTGPGDIMLLSSRLAKRPIYGFRRGLEYFGNRLYQPGDSLKHIDWKSTIKHGVLISKEFLEFHGQPVIALINLCVKDEEEADRLAYWIIISALTLAHENVPTIMAAYDHEKVRIITPMLNSRQLIIQSLEIARQMVTYINPVTYLNPPDITRLRADITRLTSSGGIAVKKLVSLLEMEYENLSQSARKHPATLALLQAFSKRNSQYSILIISHYNHDSMALAFNTANFLRRGNAVIPLNSQERRKEKAAMVRV